MTITQPQPGRLHVQWEPIAGARSIDVSVSPGEGKTVVPSRTAVALAVGADADFVVTLFVRMLDGTSRQEVQTGHSIPYTPPIADTSVPGASAYQRQSCSDGTKSAFLSVIYGATTCNLVIMDGAAVSVIPLPGAFVNLSTARIALSGADLFMVIGQGTIYCYHFTIAVSMATLVDKITLSTASQSPMGVLKLKSGNIAAWVQDAQAGQVMNFQFFLRSAAGWSAPTKVASQVINSTLPLFTSDMAQPPFDDTLWALFNVPGGRYIKRLRMKESDGILILLDDTLVVSEADGDFIPCQDESWISAVAFGQTIAIGYIHVGLTNITSPVYALETIQSGGQIVENLKTGNIGICLCAADGSRSFVDFPHGNRWIADWGLLTARGATLTLTWRALDPVDASFQELYSSDYSGTWGQPAHVATLSRTQWNTWMLTGETIMATTPAGIRLIRLPGAVTPPIPPNPPVKVVITPSGVTLHKKDKQQFMANMDAKWSLSGAGNLTSSGLYTAPGSPHGASATVKATSTVDPANSATAQVTVVPG